MRIQDALHICRNPWGWHENLQREARLVLADEVERLSREVEQLTKDLEEVETRAAWLETVAFVPHAMDLV